MVILKSQNKITDLFMILAWASPFNDLMRVFFMDMDILISTMWVHNETGEVTVPTNQSEPDSHLQLTIWRILSSEM